MRLFSRDYYRALADINHQLSDTSAVRVTLMGNSTGVVATNKLDLTYLCEEALGSIADS